MKIIKVDKLVGELSPPPSKSVLHRYIIASSLAKGISKIENISFSEDIIATIEAMKKLGAKIEQKDNYLLIDGSDTFKNLNENIEIGVFKGDATNLVNVPTGSQAKVIIENPFGFNPTNSEILRVLQKGGELRITGTRYFKDMLKDSYKPPKGFKVIKKGDILESKRRQGFQKDGKTNRETN